MKETVTPRHGRLAPLAPIACGLGWILTVSLSIPLADLYQTGADEGMELGKALVRFNGCNPSAVMWNDQPFTLTRLWLWLFDLFGPDATAPRYVALAFSGVLIASASALAMSVTRNLASAITTALVLASSQVFVSLSIAAMQEVPGLALAYFSLFLAERARRSPFDLIRPAICGSFLGVAGAIKLTMLTYSVGCVWLLLQPVDLAAGNRRESHETRVCVRIMICAIFSLLSLTAILAANDDLSWDRLVGTHLTAAILVTPEHFFRPDLLRITAQSGPWLMTVVGVWAFLWLAWFWIGSGQARTVLAAAFAPLVGFLFLAVAVRPWWAFYSVHLHAALAVFTGVLIGCQRITPAGGKSCALLNRVIRFGGPALVVVAALYSLDQLRLWSKSLRISQSRLLQRVASYLPPDCYIFCENPLLAVHLKACIPPESAWLFREKGFSLAIFQLPPFPP